MGAYFQYVNLDRLEVINLSSVWNIKGGAYTSWGLQTALLQVFLGGPAGREFNPPELIGRWQGQRVAIECDDYGPNWTRSDSVEWPDAGMAALVWMLARPAPGNTSLLTAWLSARDFEFRDDQYDQLHSWLRKQVNPMNWIESRD